MNRRLRSLLLLLPLIAFRCTEAPDAVFDNPNDPENFNALLSAPYGVTSAMSGTNAVQLMWTEDNFSTEGFIVERAGLSGSAFTVIAERPKSGYREIEAGPNWIFYALIDSAVNRADGGYQYRVRCYNRRDGKNLVSANSAVHIFTFP